MSIADPKAEGCGAGTNAGQILAFNSGNIE